MSNLVRFSTLSVPQWGDIWSSYHHEQCCSSSTLIWVLRCAGYPWWDGAIHTIQQTRHNSPTILYPLPALEFHLYCTRGVRYQCVFWDVERRIGWVKRKSTDTWLAEGVDEEEQWLFQCSQVRCWIVQITLLIAKAWARIQWMSNMEN